MIFRGSMLDIRVMKMSTFSDILNLERPQVGTVSNQQLITLLLSVFWNFWCDHVLVWWEHRNHPNVLFLTYEDLHKVWFAKVNGEKYLQFGSSSSTPL